MAPWHAYSSAGKAGRDVAAADLLDQIAQLRQIATMDYQRFRAAFLAALEESHLPTIGHPPRTRSTEEGMLAELLGREDASGVDTERPWLRVDIRLCASLVASGSLPMPNAATWAK
jgi:hypothetical protein